MGFIAVYWKLLGSFTIVLVLMAEGFFGLLWLYLRWVD